MAKREALIKLPINSLRSLAEDYGIETKKKKKEQLIREVLTQQTPVSALTPVVFDQDSVIGGVAPSFTENLPPYNTVRYDQKLVGLPSISFIQIYDFMIRRERVPGETVNNFKGLDRAVKHFSAGDVQIHGVSKIDDNTVYIKASCQASMKKISYELYVCVHKHTIKHGYCQCPIGLAQTCSHIGSLLFAVRDGSSTDDSCTSKLCECNVPRHKSKPVPVSHLTVKRPTLNSTILPQAETLATFDPRHSRDKLLDMNSTLGQLRRLRDIFPNTGLTHLWNIPEEVPEMSMEIEVSTSPDMPEMEMDVSTSPDMPDDIDPMQGEMKKMIFTSGNFPPVSIDEDLVAYIEKNTRDQRNSDIWRKLHLGRLTSSKFGDVLKAGKNPNSFIREIVEGSNLDRYSALPTAIQWGVESEKKAIVDYINFRLQFVQNVAVEATGLTLCSSYSFLGASSDGRILEHDEHGDDRGILEIKCPFSLKGTRVNHMPVLDIVDLGDKDFCLVGGEEGVHLNKKHKYYAQVQGEMAMMGSPWCDFVVWTAAPSYNIFVDRIYFDAEYVTDMLPKLLSFYMNHVFPKLEK